MIHVCVPVRPAGVEDMLAALATYQAEVDRYATYAERVAAAKAQWDSRRSNAPINTVRAMLLAMCSGIGRCMYCEDSRAHDIEHVRPKALYPGLVFAWANFLYACASCNGQKGARFEVVLPDGRVVAVGRRRGAAIPAQLAADDPLLVGEPLLIDPRCEDPLDFLRLDLETGWLDERDQNGIRHKRAAYTLSVLELNEREYLVSARQAAYHAAESLLRDYARLRREGAGPELTEPKRRTILAGAHRTVWEEMKRQREQRRNLRVLFAEAPEALGW
jgi:uncharacterized protein (TIGR02646 family)